MSDSRPRHDRNSRVVSSFCWAGAALCLLVAAHARPAAACSTTRPPIALDGYPNQGAIDVPTDVLPIYSIFLARVNAGPGVDFEGPFGSFELTSEAGDTIALEPRVSDVWHFELVPAAPLAPSTRYTLRGRWPELRVGNVNRDVEMSLTFTTGAGPVAAPPPPPQAKLQHYSFTEATLSSCDPPQHGSCLSHPGALFVEHVYLNSADDQHSDSPSRVENRYLSRGSAFMNLSGIEQGTPWKCVRLRARGHNGMRSEPVTLCGEDAPRYTLPRSGPLTCTADGFKIGATPIDQTPRGGGEVPAQAPSTEMSPTTAAASPSTPPAEAPSCSFGGQRTTGNIAGLAMLAGVAVLAFGRRKQRTQDAPGR